MTRKLPSRPVLRRLKLLVLDVDGTLTDGRLYYGPDGEALKVFDVRDGHGLVLLRELTDVRTALLTGRSARMSESRARDLQIGLVVGSARDKGPALEKLVDGVSVSLAETAYVGDDVNDLPALERAGFSACPADAAPEVRRAVDFVSRHPGGRGAVREVCERILAARGLWPPRPGGSRA